MSKKAAKWKTGTAAEFLQFYKIEPGDKQLYVDTPKGIVVVRYNVETDTTEVITRAKDDIAFLTEAIR